MNPDTYNCRLNAVNIVVSLINFLLPAIDWVLVNHPELYKSYVIFGISENGCLAVSCAILVWGFQRLIKTVQSGNDHFVNKPLISWHIAAYVFIILVNIVCLFTMSGAYSYEVSTYCDQAIYLVCSVILAMIVNEICSKSIKAKSSEWSSFACF